MQFKRDSFSAETSLPAGLPAELEALVGFHALSFSDALNVLETSALLGAPLGRVLMNEFGIDAVSLLDARQSTSGALRIDLSRTPADPVLVAEFGVRNAMHLGVLPWRRIGSETIVLAEHPELSKAQRSSLEATFGDVRLALASETDIQSAVQVEFGTHLSKLAESRLPSVQSCRTWDQRLAACLAISVGCVLAVAGLFAPGILLSSLAGFTLFGLALSTLMTIAAAFASSGRFAKTEYAALQKDQLPTISLLVPLFEENRIADHLLKRLSALDYPSSLLEVCLVLEASDQTTQKALSEIHLPAWLKIIQVPDSKVKTKPKALNYALDVAKGEIVGIYDAEDAPDTNQLQVVAQSFARAKSDVGCLQGTLDYYNSRANWLTRCFTIEYAAWFRVVLPGLAQLGFAVPLGGTTIFFRREALDKLGAWDAYNVTEDADLGIRLARRGFRTEFIRTVTYEEANGRVWPWIRQRSRWLKGYAMTYAIHMRNPLTLWKDLGPRKFWGFQILFLGSITQFALAPLLWALWVLPLIGLPLLDGLLPAGLVLVSAIICVFGAVTNFFIHCLGTSRADKKWLWPWAVTMGLYFPLATIALYKGLWELVRKPFFWDKTEHGVLMPDQPTTSQIRPLPHQV